MKSYKVKSADQRHDSYRETNPEVPSDGVGLIVKDACHIVIDSSHYLDHKEKDSEDEG